MIKDYQKASSLIDEGFLCLFCRTNRNVHILWLPLNNKIMHLKHFMIDRFRGIFSLNVDQVEQLNLFVGRNNSSKTSILEALFMLCGAGNPELAVRIDNFRNLAHTEADDFRFIFHKMNFNDNIFIGGAFDTNGYARSLLITAGKSDYQLKNSDNENKIPLYSDINKINIYDNSLSSDINKLNFEILAKYLDMPVIEYNNEIIFNYGMRIDPNYKEILKVVYVLPYAYGTGGMDKKLEQLIINKKLGFVLKALRQIDSSILSVALGTNNMIYFDTGLDRLIPISLFGDGVKRLLYILLSIVDAKDGIVLIDEIDNGLHFSALKSLWSSIIVAAKDYNVQIFATTHNYETLKYLKETLDQDNFKDFQSKVMNFSVRKLPDSSLKAYAYPFANFEFAIEEGIEIR